MKNTLSFINLKKAISLLVFSFLSLTFVFAADNKGNETKAPAIKAAMEPDSIAEKEELPEKIIISPEHSVFGNSELELSEYLSKKVMCNPASQRMGVRGVVILEFTVQKDGSISDARVVKGLGYGLDEMALEALKTSPNWKPAKQRGRVVAEKKLLPIRFTCQDRY